MKLNLLLFLLLYLMVLNAHPLLASQLESPVASGQGSLASEPPQVNQATSAGSEASEKQVGAQNNEEKTANPSPSKSARRSTPSSQKKVSLPVRFFSLATGIVVGAPIASVRRAFGEDREAAETVTYGNKSSGLKMAARTVLFPVCVISGAIEGVSYAVENSCKYCGTEPLSRKSFSLGKLGADEI